MLAVTDGGAGQQEGGALGAMKLVSGAPERAGPGRHSRQAAACEVIEGSPHAHNGGVVPHLEELTSEGNVGVSLFPSAERGAVSGEWASSLSAATQRG